MCFGDSQVEGGPILLVIKEKIYTMDEDAFHLKIEGITVVKCSSFLEIMTSLIAAIYCFNLVYPKCIEKTMKFIQNIILGLKDGGCVDKKIVSVVSAINRVK